MSISSKKILTATRQTETPKFFSFITDDIPFSILGNNFFFADMCFDSAGNIYIVGGGRSQYPMKIYQEDVCEGYTFLAIKLNSNYEVQWQKDMGSLPMAKCCLIASNSGNEYLVIGHAGSFGNCSMSTMDMSTGAFIDQKRYDQANALMHSIQKIIPDPSVDGRLHTVGSLWRSSGSREMAAGGLINMTSAGVLSAGGTFRIQYWNARNDNSTWYDAIYDNINDFYMAVGHYAYNNSSSDLAVVSTPSFGTEFLNARILTRDGREPNSYTTSITMDSSGYKYLTHSDGKVTKVNWVDGNYATTTAEWRYGYNSLYDNIMSTAALSSDENYLYVGTRKGAILKISTSDGSLVEKMAWPNDNASTTTYDYASASFSPIYLATYGINKIYVQDSNIYILLNVKAKMSSAAGNLIVIPESAFGTDLRLGNGNGLINADQLGTTTAQGLNCTSLATLGYENTSITTTTLPYVATDITNNTFTETQTSASGPIVIYGNAYNRSGSTASGGKNCVITEDLSVSSVTFLPKEGDVVLYVASLGSSGIYAWFNYVVNSGYTMLVWDYGNDTYDTEMTVQWKRMGATPDTNITFPYNNGNATNSSCYQAIVLRDFNSNATPYSELQTTRGSSSWSSAPPSITPSSDAIVLFFHSYGANANGGFQSINDISYTDFTNVNIGIDGSDTYDTSLGIAHTNVISAGSTFSTAGKPAFGGADSTAYSAAAYSIAFPIE